MPIWKEHSEMRRWLEDATEKVKPCSVPAPPMTMSRWVESSHNCLPVVVIVTPTRVGMGQPSASPYVFITIHCCLLIKSQQDNSLSLVACVYPLQSQTASQPARDLAWALFSTHMCFPPHKMWHKLMIPPNPRKKQSALPSFP